MPDMNSLIPAVPDVLFHYTCVDHGHPGIFGTGVVQPRGSGGLAWFTDLEYPNPAALGLVLVSRSCSRWQVRYRTTHTGQFTPWLALRNRLLQENPALREEILEIEGQPGAMPRHWFVSMEDVPATYDPF